MYPNEAKPILKYKKVGVDNARSQKQYIHCDR